MILKKEQRENRDGEMKWYSYWEKIQDRTIDFPLILSNMGGKYNDGDLLNLSLCDGDIIMNFIIPDNELYLYIKDWIDIFFATHNFGSVLNRVGNP